MMSLNLKSGGGLAKPASMARVRQLAADARAAEATMLPVLREYEEAGERGLLRRLFDDLKTMHGDAVPGAAGATVSPAGVSTILAETLSRARAIANCHFKEGEYEQAAAGYTRLLGGAGEPAAEAVNATGEVNNAAGEAAGKTVNTASGAFGAELPCVERHLLLGNRSAAYAALRLFRAAEADAAAALRLVPAWAKGYIRLVRNTTRISFFLVDLLPGV